MKKYIDFNSEERMNAASFEKDFFKLMINSFHGKTMELILFSAKQWKTYEKESM